MTMFQAIRRRIHVTPSGVIAILALVFAATGGAFAATGAGGSSGDRSSGIGQHATASTGRAGLDSALATIAKKKTKAPARGPVGPKGATGATGAAGPAGATGPAGAQGPAGTSGTNGESKEGPQGKEGHEGKQGIQGNPGTNGTTGFTKTLPSGETETGVWNGVANAEGDFELSPISFNIPLAESLTGAHLHLILSGGEEFEKEEEKENPATHEIEYTVITRSPTECGSPVGSAADPKASPGNLCVYASDLLNVGFAGFITPSEFFSTPEADPTGVLMYFKGHSGPHFAIGTWAVTAK
jgi:hypothetical protein